MSRVLTNILCISALLLLAVSCNVHEMPSEADCEVYVYLKFDVGSLPIYTELDYNTGYGKSKQADDTRSDAPENYELRYLVRCFASYDDGVSYEETPCRGFVFTNTELEKIDYRCRLSLPTGKYKVRVWTDYIRKSEGTDCYYNTSDMRDISLRGSKTAYVGSTDLRQAFVGETDIFVPSVLDLDRPTAVKADIEMSRPMARYRFVATDVEEFIEKYLGITDPEEAAKIDFSQYRIVFRYTGFLPTHFNILSDKPFDAEQGYQFLSNITEVDHSEATMGFDYVFVNGHTSSVSVAIGIYNDEGELLSFSTPIEVPLLRNHETIVRGKFLTTNTYGMIAINSEYDGNYDIIVY